MEWTVAALTLSQVQETLVHYDAPGSVALLQLGSDEAASAILALAFKSVHFAN